MEEVPDGSGGSLGTSGSSTTGADDGGSSNAGGGAAQGTCQGTIMVSSSEDFADLVARGCRVVTGALRITQTDVSSLSGLVIESIGADLTIAQNPQLTSLAGLERVTHIGARMNIISNAQLSSLSPLLSWPPDTVGESISIQLNPALPQCAVEALDAHLTASCNNCASNDDDGACN